MQIHQLYMMGTPPRNPTPQAQLWTAHKSIQLRFSFSFTKDLLGIFSPILWSSEWIWVGVWDMCVPLAMINSWHCALYSHACAVLQDLLSICPEGWHGHSHAQSKIHFWRIRKQSNIVSRVVKMLCCTSVTQYESWWDNAICVCI